MVALCRLDVAMTALFVDALSSSLRQQMATSNSTDDDVTKMVTLCDGLSAINDCRCGILRGLLTDLVAALRQLTEDSRPQPSRVIMVGCC